MSPRIFILAGTHREAEEYAREKHWAPAEWRYIDSPHCLHGLRDIEVYRIGNWRSRSDLVEIYDVIKKINHVASDVITSHPDVRLRPIPHEFSDLHNKAHVAVAEAVCAERNRADRLAQTLAKLTEERECAFHAARISRARWKKERARCHQCVVDTRADPKLPSKVRWEIDNIKSRIISSINGPTRETESPVHSLREAAEWCNVLAAKKTLVALDEAVDRDRRIAANNERIALWEAANILTKEAELAERQEGR